jgi:hypothetical protein
MTTLTRRRNHDPHREGWRIFFGDVQVGTITKRGGVPIDVDQWEWRCGFFPGTEPWQQRDGSAGTYEEARAAFQSAWRDLLPQLRCVSARPGLSSVETSHVEGRPQAAGAARQRPLGMLLWRSDRPR